MTTPSAAPWPSLPRVALAAFGVLLLARGVPASLGLDAASQALGTVWLASGAAVPVACLVQRRRRPDRANTAATVTATVGFAALAAYAALADPAPTDVGGGLVVLVGLMLLLAGGLASRPPESDHAPS